MTVQPSHGEHGFPDASPVDDDRPKVNDDTFEENGRLYMDFCKGRYLCPCDEVGKMNRLSKLRSTLTFRADRKEPIGPLSQDDKACAKENRIESPLQQWITRTTLRPHTLERDDAYGARFGVWDGNLGLGHGQVCSLTSFLIVKTVR